MALPVRSRVEGRAGTSAADAIIESCVVTGRSRFTIRDGEAIINIFRVCDKALCNQWNALADRKPKTDHQHAQLQVDAGCPSSLAQRP